MRWLTRIPSRAVTAWRATPIDPKRTNSSSSPKSPQAPSVPVLRSPGTGLGAQDTQRTQSLNFNFLIWGWTGPGAPWTTSSLSHAKPPLNNMFSFKKNSPSSSSPTNASPASPVWAIQPPPLFSPHLPTHQTHTLASASLPSAALAPLFFRPRKSSLVPTVSQPGSKAGSWQKKGIGAA